MKQIVLFALLACVVFTHNDIKHVQELLGELKDEIHEQIVALDAEWVLTQKMKQASIQALRQTKVDQEADCDRRDENVINKKTEIQEMSDLIAWIQHRIHVNKNRIQTIEDLQCRQSLNFVDTVRDDKISLTVSIFVKEQLEKIVSEGTSFAQKSQAMKNILSFLQDIKEQKYEFLELTRTMEIEREENPNMIETHMGPIEMKKFQEVRHEILAVLDELEAQINSHIPIAQADMIRVGLAYLEWKQRILKENEFFEQKIVELGKQLENLGDQLLALEYSAKQCRERVTDIERAIEVAKNDSVLAYKDYVEEHERLLKQLAIFSQLYQLYDKEIDNKTTEAEKEALTQERNDHPIVGGDKSSLPPQYRDEPEEPLIVGGDQSSLPPQYRDQTEEVEPIVGADENSLPPPEGVEETEVESNEEQEAMIVGNDESSLPPEYQEPVEVPELEETEDQEQLLIKRGPLKLREVETAPSYKRSDFILLQMKQRKTEQDEVIL
ncbi:unnamed protein product [Paramecium pentaurelia]|uniref:Uncharacterized protein n=1 Tax=Paramecium pentaurelia TaxID=43138 RepID=A0A8S1TLU5_9CILI|nr:unnamed protein product [Paramecium pentaurelia]